MNLSKLFETQRVLDARIMESHPELKGQNNLDWKILALLVELGECANEWRGFKKWSKDQEPRREVEQYGFADPGGPFRYLKYPLLEEYVDCLHFILSIGIEISEDIQFEISEYFIEIENDIKSEEQICDNIIEQFYTVFYFANVVNYDCEFSNLFAAFYHLGEMLGFTWEQIEQAYYDKNAINHTRQNTGY